MKSLPMRMMAFFVAALAATACPAQELPSRVGTTTVTLPVPGGFASAGPDVAELRSLGETMTASSNRLLEFFVTEQDLRSTKAHKQPTLSRYFMVQTLRQTEARTLDARDLENVKTHLRNEAQELAKKAEASVQGQMSAAAKTIGDRAGVKDLQLRSGGMKMGEIFDETPQSLSMLAFTKYSVIANGKPIEVPMTMAMTAALLRGKLVYFYAYAMLKTPADTEWVRAQTKSWVARAIAANR